MTIAQQVGKGIRQASAATGSGKPLVGYIVRAAAIDETNYVPAASVPATAYPVDIMLGKYSVRDRESSSIAATDVKATVAADTAPVAPTTGDRMLLSEDGTEFSVVNVDPIMPGGVVLYWTVQLREGG